MAAYGADLIAGSAHLVGGSLMIVLNQLVVCYQHRAVTPQLNGEFARGSMTALVGANGCGKRPDHARPAAGSGSHPR